jgi:hypothetical protein
MAKVLRKRTSHMPKIVEASLESIRISNSVPPRHVESLLSEIVSVYHDMQSNGVSDLLPSVVLVTKPGDLEHPTYEIYRGVNVYCAAILLRWETLPVAILPESEY